MILENVPVQYMQCNAAAFTVGDKVLIKLMGRDWTKPCVIGFKENPKPCDGDIFCMQFEKPWRDDGGPLKPDDMFFRVYFRLNSAGYPTEISETVAEKFANTSDIWSETLWRNWMCSTTDGQVDCDPEHKFATGRRDIGTGLEASNSQIIVKLPNGIQVSIATTGVGITAWTKENSKFLLFLQHYLKWAHYVSGTYPWYKGIYLPRVYFPDPAGFFGMPTQD